MKCKVMRVAERAGSTADVAGPRPREVGGACRIQVLAVARTQETVGGPNGAKRSEFRRRCPPVGVTQLKRKALKAGNAHGTPQTTGANPAFLPPSPFILNFTGANRGFLPPSLKPRVQMRVFCPRRVHLRPVCARNPFTQHVIFSKSTCLHNRKPQNRHYSALGPLCLKTNCKNRDYLLEDSPISRRGSR